MSFTMEVGVFRVFDAETDTFTERLLSVEDIAMFSSTSHFGDVLNTNGEMYIGYTSGVVCLERVRDALIEREAWNCVAKDELFEELIGRVKHKQPVKLSKQVATIVETYIKNPFISRQEELKTQEGMCDMCQDAILNCLFFIEDGKLSPDNLFLNGLQMCLKPKDGK